MARSLGLEVIAEGVETEEQLALLAREGCTLYQGFLCSPPVDVETWWSWCAGSSVRLSRHSRESRRSPAFLLSACRPFRRLGNLK